MNGPMTMLSYDWKRLNRESCERFPKHDKAWDQNVPSQAPYAIIFGLFGEDVIFIIDRKMSDPEIFIKIQKEPRYAVLRSF
jgi:hypothetical protein